MTECQLPEKSPNEDEITAILRQAKTVAVVGISDNETRDSHKVAKYLKEHGYRMIPVNPKCREVLGETCYAGLKDVPVHIDVVDIFRNLEAIPGIVDEAIEIKADVVWMQLGLSHPEAGEKARAAGLQVVMNHCIKIEHSKICRS